MPVNMIDVVFDNEQVDYAANIETVVGDLLVGASAFSADDRDRVFHFTDLPPLFTEQGYASLFPEVSIPNVDGEAAYPNGRVGWFCWIDDARSADFSNNTLKINSRVTIVGAASLNSTFEGGVSDTAQFKESRRYINSVSERALIKMQDLDARRSMLYTNPHYLLPYDLVWSYVWGHIAQTYFYQCQAHLALDIDVQSKYSL